MVYMESRKMVLMNLQDKNRDVEIENRLWTAWEGEGGTN